MSALGARRGITLGALGALAAAALSALVAALPAAAQAPRAGYDLVIRGGRVLDGTGNPWYLADVAIAGDRIVAVGEVDATRARRVIDARGLYVAPGFIDAHSHAAAGLAAPALREARPLLAQGVTTVVINPDGGGPVDLARQRQQLTAGKVGVNAALLVPHGAVRRAVLGMADRAPTAAELERMRALVRAGMEAGAYGLSSGPFYAPGSFAKTDELVELAKVAAPYGGAYSSHIRDEGDYGVGVVAAVDEVIRVAREAGVPGVVTHIKALGPGVWGYAQALVSRIDRARAEGVQVYADQYPYEASKTGLDAALVPRWAQAGGGDSLARRLDDPATGTRVRAEMAANLARRGGAARIQFSEYARDRSIEGRTLAQVAAERRVEPVALAESLVRGGGGPSIVSFNMDEGDVTTLMRQPWTMTASDGALTAADDGVPHPRSYGTFPRKIRRYVVERGVVDLAAAVRSMTSLPATVFRLRDRGVLRPGAYADVVVFDLATLQDRATYDRPHQAAEGVVHLLVNGAPAIEGGTATGALAGRVLDRRASEPAPVQGAR